MYFYSTHNNKNDKDNCNYENDVVYISTKSYKIPGFHPIDAVLQKQIAEKYGLEYVTNLNYLKYLEFNLKHCILTKVEATIGVGSLFRALSHIFTRSQENHFQLRQIIT